MKHLLDPYLRLAAVFLGGSLLVSFLFSVLWGAHCHVDHDIIFPLHEIGN